jgi:hypothetical protein
MSQQTIDEAVAAPPDDGHQGSHTRPEDVLEVRAADRPPAAPALHRDPNRTVDGRVNPMWILFGALAVLAVIVYFSLWQGPVR